MDSPLDPLYAASIGSFPTPVPLPITDPRDSPTKAVSINCDWLPYVRGSLFQLLLPATWKTTNPADLALVQERAATLISLFTECVASPPPFACPYDFTAQANGLPFTLQVDLYDNVPPRGAFHVGIGWETVQTYEPGGFDYWTFLDIACTLPVAVQLGIVQATFGHITLGSNYLGQLHGNASGFRIYHSGSIVSTYLIPSDTLPTGVGGVLANDFGGVLADKIRLSILVGLTQFAPSDGDGTVVAIQFDGHAAGFSCP